jgi:osmoprotectant transport system ATP-binding protein
MIVLENVSKTFDGGARYSVQGVSLHVPRGKMLVLLGGSGCGKTTTLKMINRLIDPTSGRITVNGRDVRRTDPVEMPTPKPPTRKPFAS